MSTISRLTRIGATVSASAAVAFASLVGSPATAQAASGTVTTAVNVRQGPSVWHDSVRVLSVGTPVNIECKTPGTTHGVTRYWFKIGTRQYVSANYVSGGSSSPLCSETRVNDYPYTSDGTDRWQFTRGQCTSFVAWRMEQRLRISGFNRGWTDDGVTMPRGDYWGGAHDWNDTARVAGVSVGTLPVIGAVAVQEITSSAPVGHVAYVTKVNLDGSFVIEEMNYGGPFRYNTRTITPGNNPFSSFVYF